MPKTPEGIIQRMEELLVETERLYEEHRKAMQEYQELKAALKTLVDGKRKGR